MLILIFPHVSYIHSAHQLYFCAQLKQGKARGNNKRIVFFYFGILSKIGTNTRIYSLGSGMGQNFDPIIEKNKTPLCDLDLWLRQLKI